MFGCHGKYVVLHRRFSNSSPICDVYEYELELGLYL